MNASFDGNEIIDLLESNKEYPYYAAEKRIDLFFTFFIETILSEYFKTKVIFVAPEFPIKHTSTNRTDNADMLCVIVSTGQPIYVELKTDSRSFKSSQFESYIKRSESWSDSIAGLRSLVANTTSSNRVKFFHLMQSLVLNNLAYYNSYDSSFEVRIMNLLSTESVNEKSERSRLIKQLSSTLECKWKGQAKVLYVAPSSVINSIHSRFDSEKVDLLEFSKIREDVPDTSAMYSKFVKFLHGIA